MLEALGLPFEVVVPDVEELTEGEPGEVVIENARRKARSGMAIASGAGPVLGVDTEVVLDGRVVGKASDAAQARTRLEALSGRTHEVLSGIVLIANQDSSRLQFVPPEGTNDSLGDDAPPSVPDAGAVERSGLARSSVTFRDLCSGLIEAYLASGEWRDRAGAYAIQGLGSSLVERIDGDLSNVIGLPVSLLLELIPDLLDAAGDSRP